LDDDIIEQFKETSFYMKPNEEQFNELFGKHNYITFTMSNSGSNNILCIPEPKYDFSNNILNYHTMKDFINNSPKEQQIIFWKIVSKIIKFLVKDKKETIKVKTHGHYVPWFHFRLERGNKTNFINEISDSIKSVY
jgi:hypothetical protein